LNPQEIFTLFARPFLLVFFFSFIIANTRFKGIVTDRADDYAGNASNTPTSGFYPASDFPATPEPSAKKKKKRKAKAAPKKSKKKPIKRETPEKISDS
jgi:hypothetical protein